MDTDTIKTLIERGLPGAKAVVQGADGVHFEATVVAPAFAGKLPLARHRMTRLRSIALTCSGAVQTLSPSRLCASCVCQSNSVLRWRDFIAASCEYR